MNHAVVRAKFTCNYKTPLDNYGAKITFNPVGPTYVNNKPVFPAGSDNEKFWDSSPSGEITLWVKNVAAVAQFEQGKSYYIDFIPAD